MPLWISSTALPRHRRLSQDLHSPVTASPLIAESDTMHGYYTITTWQLSFFTIKKQTGPRSTAAGCQNMEVSRQEDRFYSEGRGPSMGCLARSYVGTTQGAVKNVSIVKRLYIKGREHSQLIRTAKSPVRYTYRKVTKTKVSVVFFTQSWLLE